MKKFIFVKGIYTWIRSIFVFKRSFGLFEKNSSIIPPLIYDTPKIFSLVLVYILVLVPAFRQLMLGSFLKDIRLLEKTYLFIQATTLES